MATAKQIEIQSQLVEVLSREVDGIQDLITGITGIDTWTIICLVRKDLIDNLISQLETAKNLDNGDPLKEAILIFNTGNTPITTSVKQIDAVGDHLKDTFLPVALTQKESERDIEIDTLKDMRDGLI